MAPSKAVEEAKAKAKEIKATDTEPEDEGNEDDETEDDSDTVAIQTGFGEVRVPAADLDHTPKDDA